MYDLSSGKNPMLLMSVFSKLYNTWRIQGPCGHKHTPRSRASYCTCMLRWPSPFDLVVLGLMGGGACLSRYMLVIGLMIASQLMGLVAGAHAMGDSDQLERAEPAPERQREFEPKPDPDSEQKLEPEPELLCHHSCDGQSPSGNH
jgi:hypothetical protein